MTGILDRLSRSMTFMRADTISDVFAIEIARRLEDVPSLHRYQRFTRKLPLAQVLDFYGSVSASGRAHERRERLKSACEAALLGKEMHE